MAESRPTSSPSPDDMHWGISFLREDLQDVKLDVRKEVADSRAETSQQFTELRAEMRRDNRHTLMAMITVTGALTGIVIAFLQYRLPA